MPPPRLKRSNTAGAVPASLEDAEIAINQADGRLYYRTVAGGVASFNALPSADSTMTGALTVQPTVAPAIPGGGVQVIGDGQPAAFSLYRYSDAAAGQTGFYVNRMRGSRTSPAPLQANDNLGGISWNSIGTTGARIQGGYVVAACTQAPVAGDTAMRSQLQFAAADGTSQPVVFTISATVCNVANALTVGGTAVVVTSDPRLSDARTPTSHTHGNLTNAGAIGTTSGLPVITTTGGVLTVGAFGTAAGSFCQGNDARLSDTRTPTDGSVTTAKIVDGSITTAKLADGAVATVDIANSAVTYAKIQNVSVTDRLLGRATAGAGVVEEIVCTSAGRSLLSGADASAQRTTLGLGSVSTQAADSVAIAGGAIDGTPIGGTTASTGAFTTVSATGVVTVSAGAANAPAICFSGDTNTGVLAPAADTFAVATGGVERLRITSDGKVGINVTPAASVTLIHGVSTAASTSGNESGINTTLNCSATSGSGLRIGFSSTVNSTASQVAGFPMFGVVSNIASNSPASLSGAQAFRATCAMQSGSGSLSSYTGYYAVGATVTGGTVTTQYGFLCESSLTNATNNYGFTSQIAAGTGRWNLNITGTAQNYIAGNVGIGSGKTVPATALDVSGVITVTSTAGTAGVDIIGDMLRVRTARTPASSTAAGNAGEFCWDSSYLYICIASGTWRRIAHSTW